MKGVNAIIFRKKSDFFLDFSPILIETITCKYIIYSRTPFTHSRFFLNERNELGLRGFCKLIQKKYPVIAGRCC